MSKFGACVDSTLTWIGNNKLSTILGIIAFSLMVSTWSLAAINSNLNHDIASLNDRIAQLEGKTTATPETSEKTTEHPNPSDSTSAVTESTTTVTSETTTDSGTGGKSELRLNEFIVPSHYDLLIHPDITPWKNDPGNENGGMFSGNVKIKINIGQPTDEIILHAHELTITKVVFTAPGSNARVLNYQLIMDMEQLKVVLNEEVPVTEDCLLEIDFRGSMRNKIVGLYSSTYKDPLGNDR